jgi:cytoskeletal protein RodZ
MARASEPVDVDQISLPYRIALVALLVVCALWFTVLQPKDPAVEPLPTAPGTTGLANDVSAAKGAVAASEASAAAKSAATSDGSTGAATKSSTGGTHAAAVGAKAKPATATGAKTAKKAAKKKAAKPAAAADRSAPLLRALERDRAVVLLFFNKRGLEDKAVRRAVTGVDRRDGRVVVKAVPVADVARYQAITRGAQVLQAPTALVIAPGKTVKPIVGYTTTAELDQAVGDALAGKRAKK